MATANGMAASLSPTRDSGAAGGDAAGRRAAFLAGQRPPASAGAVPCDHSLLRHLLDELRLGELDHGSLLGGVQAMAGPTRCPVTLSISASCLKPVIGTRKACKLLTADASRCPQRSSSAAWQCLRVAPRLASCEVVWADYRG